MCMRRILINTLAILGAMTVLEAISRFIIRHVADKTTGIVLGPDHKPLAHVPVFLDRGGWAIERYLTDDRGAFAFHLEPREVRRSIWLICAPRGIPAVNSRDDGQIGPTTYGYASLAESTWGFYRATGWRGPIPRECPRATDTVGWQYPPSAGKPKDAFTTTEPEWPR
jgi:hypothetical protein